MAKKFLFVTLAIVFAFGMTVSGCKEVDEEGFKDRSVNLKKSGNNSITITVKGATWKDFTGDGLNLATQETFCSQLLEWTPASGSDITKFEYLNKEFSLTKGNKLTIEFSKYSLPGTGVGLTGSGTVKLQDLSSTTLMAYLFGFAEDVEKAPDWAIGTNETVTITIK